MDADRERMYRALCAYQDDGVSVEEAARRYGVNPHSMRRRMRQQGWVMRSSAQTPKKRQGRSSSIPDAALAESIAGTPTWMLAQRYGVAVRTMQAWLRERDANKQTRFTEQHAQQMSDKARPMVERIVALREQGLTHGQIGIRLGINASHSSAVYSRWSRKRYRWQRDTSTITNPTEGSTT